MRKLTIIRKKTFSASLIKVQIVLDGEVVAILKNGETIEIEIDEGIHEVFTQSKLGKGDLTLIKPGEEDLVVHLSPDLRVPKFNLKFENPNLEFDDSNLLIEIKDPKQVKEPKSMLASYLCGVIIALILLGVSTYVFFNDKTTIINYIISVVLSVLSGFTIILGGFWFIVVPLPYIAIWRFGCLKPNQSLGRKVFLGVLSFIIPVSVFLILFL